MAEPVGNMRRILCSNCPPERAHLVRREFPILIQRKKKNYLEKQLSYVWTIPAIRSQKAAKDSKKQDNINDKLKRFSLVYLVQTQGASFPVFRNE